MKLWQQILIVSLPLLLVPWAGCAFLAENERALRSAQQQAAETLATTAASALSDQPSLLYPWPKRIASDVNAQGLLVSELAAPPTVDGWLEEWERLPSQAFGEGRRSLQVQAGRYQQTLFLAVTIREPLPTYHNPQGNAEWRSDRLQLALGSNERQLVIAPEGPGQSVVWWQRGDTREPMENTQAWWEETADGYQVELMLPVDITGGRVSIDYRGVDDGGEEVVRGRRSPMTNGNPWLIMAPPDLLPWVKRLSRDSDSRIAVLDRWQWPLAEAGDVPQTPAESHWALRWLYRQVLPAIAFPEMPALTTDGRRAVPAPLDAESIAGLSEQGPVMQTLAPIRTAGEITGYIVVTEPFHEFLALTDKAFAALLARGLLAMLLGAGVMLAFAAVLGWRLRRIHQTLQTESLLKGQIDPLPISPLGDEIDELATRFNQQLGELSDYQRYLTSLNQTLAHELRTPVAIIASSLDNLREVAATGGQGDELLERARVGVERLQAVFSALQEARRIEQALDGYEQEKTDLVALLTQLCTAYQQTLPTHAFSLASDAEVASAIIAPDAVVQAIDKLVDNAVSFSPADTGVVLRLEARGLWWRIGVENTGPSLPNPDDQSLFEPLVSRRSEKDDHQHMGLGLHIVRLVARQHGGEPFAQNLPDGSGVRVGFTVRQ